MAADEGYIMTDLTIAVTGAMIMLIITPIFHPLSRKLESISQRIYRIKPVSVHVETDPSIAWAGFPNWIAAWVWLPRLPDGSPPEHPTDWRNWALNLGGCDAYVTVLKVTITSRTTTTVVVDQPKLRFKKMPAELSRGGVIATNPVGGAALEPRRIEVRPEIGTSMWIDEEGQSIRPLGLTLSPGEVEQFYIFTRVDSGLYEWRLELPVLVDGKRTTVPISGPHEGWFRTCGLEDLKEHVYIDNSWQIVDAV
ncbi:hypothetical protein [Streptomyces sp. NPDC000877]|uniref:hypothetical protein n=1 Tax=unclassified Streptomyces TaxID=2593676 RepID=UPI003320D105